MESKIAIARAGSKLGTFSPEQVENGLRSGLFRPSDHYWQPGSKAWATLATLHPGLGSNPHPASVSPPKAAPSPQSSWGWPLKALIAMAIIALLAIIVAETYLASSQSGGKKAEAEYHFQQAAGICKSLPGDRGLMLAVLLSHGAFSAGDPEIAELQRALPHLRIAAEKGHREAQYFVGSTLKLDPGNKAEAEAFLIRAAKQGHPLASRVLSAEYLLRPQTFGRKVEDGITWHLITPPNLREPLITSWLSNANEGGPAIEAARKRAAEFRPISE